MKLRKRDGAMSFLKNVIITVAVLAVFIAMIVFAISEAEQSRRNENALIIENGVKKAAVECYAEEGFYPDSIDYLIENYSLYTDSENCIIHYSPISSNIMPDIKVIAK